MEKNNHAPHARQASNKVVGWCKVLHSQGVNKSDFDSWSCMHTRRTLGRFVRTILNSPNARILRRGATRRHNLHSILVDDGDLFMEVDVSQPGFLVGHVFGGVFSRSLSSGRGKPWLSDVAGNVVATFSSLPGK
jgi:hypothetical protein